MGREDLRTAQVFLDRDQGCSHPSCTSLERYLAPSRYAVPSESIVMALEVRSGADIDVVIKEGL